jgi:hypothetical protein
MNNETYGVTAKRIAKGSKKVVIVNFPHGGQVTLGGARAERATALVVAEYAGGILRVVGLRADARKAASEAACLLAPKPGRDRWGHRYPANPAALKAAAIPVEDSVS